MTMWRTKRYLKNRLGKRGGVHGRQKNDRENLAGLHSSGDGVLRLSGADRAEGIQGDRGFREVLVLRREIGDETEYVLVTLWDSMEAIRGFAGPEPERAVYYPEDSRYFPEEEMRPYVTHYEVLAAS